MPLPKHYSTYEFDFEDWNDLADNYAGKAATLIVDAACKGDYNTFQEAVDALPVTNTGEILVKGCEYLITKAVVVKDRGDFHPGRGEGDEGISISDNDTIIEVDFLYGSRMQQSQRSGRLLHSQKEATNHYILMTEEELTRYGKRLLALYERGYRVNIVR